MKDQLTELLSKEMDRKEFLRTVGVGALLLLGGGVILSALNGLTRQGGATNSGATRGYGISAYGGSPRIGER